MSADNTFRYALDDGMDNTFRYALDDGEEVILSTKPIGWINSMADVDQSAPTSGMTYAEFEQSYNIIRGQLTVGQCIPIGEIAGQSSLYWVDLGNDTVLLSAGPIWVDDGVVTPAWAAFEMPLGQFKQLFFHEHNGTWETKRCYIICHDGERLVQI